MEGGTCDDCYVFSRSRSQEEREGSDEDPQLNSLVPCGDLPPGNTKVAEKVSRLGGAWDKGSRHVQERSASITYSINVVRTSEKPLIRRQRTCHINTLQRQLVETEESHGGDYS